MHSLPALNRVTRMWTATAAACLLASGIIWAQPPAAEQPPSQAPDLSLSQQQVADRFKKLEELLLRSAELEATENPTRSALLQQAAQMGKSAQLSDLLARAANRLEKKQFSQAIEDQKSSRESLKRLLELLQSENREERVRQQRDQVRRWIEETDRLLRMQKSLSGRTEGGQEFKQASNDQSQLAKKAAEIAKDLGAGQEKDTNAADSDKAKEPSDNQEQPGNDPSGDAKPSDANKDSQDPSKSQSPDAKPSDAKPSDPSSSDSQPSDSQPSEAKPKQSNEDPASKDDKTPKGDSEDKPNDSTEGDKPSDSTKNESDGKSPAGKPEQSAENPSKQPSSQSKQQGQPQQGQGQSEQGEQGGAQEPKEPEPKDPAERAKKRIEQARKKMEEAKKALDEAERKGALKSNGRPRTSYGLLLRNWKRFCASCERKRLNAASRRSNRDCERCWTCKTKFWKRPNVYRKSVAIKRLAKWKSEPATWLWNSAKSLARVSVPFCCYGKKAQARHFLKRWSKSTAILAMWQIVFPKQISEPSPPRLNRRS